MTFNTNKQKKIIIFSRKHRNIYYFVQTFIIFVQINKHLSAPKKNIVESIKKKRMSSHEFTPEE